MVTLEQAPTEVTKMMPKDQMSYIWGLNVDKMQDVTEQQILAQELSNLNLDEQQ